MESDEIKFINEDALEMTENSIRDCMTIARRLGLKYRDPQVINMIMSWGSLVDKCLDLQAQSMKDMPQCGSDCGCGSFSVKE